MRILEMKPNPGERAMRAPANVTEMEVWAENEKLTPRQRKFVGYLRDKERVKKDHRVPVEKGRK